MGEAAPHLLPPDAGGPRHPARQRVHPGVPERHDRERGQRVQARPQPVERAVPLHGAAAPLHAGRRELPPHAGGLRGPGGHVGGHRGPSRFRRLHANRGAGHLRQGRAMRCTVTVEGRMPSLNDYISAERANRYKAAAMKKRETARVRAAAMQQRAPRFERRVTVRTTFYEPDMRRDADNVGFARKFVLDGLVAAGVIKDDSRKYVEQCPDRVLTDRARPRVVVEVSDE
ncbi:RusA family crossover junction endodeoxyribonuclease [Collinsella sp. AM40-7AC]|nr:RusA family crossover junction endodeoxyribonuclease [Collinsella sp. AF20-14LB]RHB19741.1 RusA family crossover junction endodeoxyribonuclease [Collinsella sp. AM40-7AC]RHO43508.1 RusA family crossover junction endodeoxyribonuclease [Eggerthella sp. AM16-19]